MSAAESIFAKIVAGEIPCHRVFENDHLLAFLDINPLAKGHTLVIPKTPVSSLTELAPAVAAEIGQVLGHIARAVTEAVDAPTFNVLLNDGPIAGQEIPYVHFHIVPRRQGDGLGYRWKAAPGDHAALSALAETIQARL